MAHPDRIVEVFNDAKSSPAGSERDQLLAGLCGEDAELRGQVESLLLAHEEAGKFMQTRPASSRECETTMKRSRAETAGERIGRYRLLQEIGQGGFGTVWMAEQMEPVSRRVAFKIIKVGMNNKEVIARFEAERQALAMMNHPNIAQVFDAGATQVGRPYFVMELVKGIPITQFCDERKLRTQDRMALFGDVCSAINHAHQKGIIHRDIKPSNVIITLQGDKPVVKVIDFGIAKPTHGRLTDKTMFTRFEQIIGTPAYMSPEQAAADGLDIDTRSDIYSLGILLYELLTGKPPFDAKTLVSSGYEEMRRIIREVDPPKPSAQVSVIIDPERTALANAHGVAPEKLNRLIEPDLDGIVMKAIDKDRSRRYETANGFALDIQHYLADEPVSAMPPSTSYRFRKFTRRNKVVLGLAAALTTLLVATTVLSSWLGVRAMRAEKLAVDRLAQVSAERDAKELARNDAEAVSNFMLEVFQDWRPGAAGRTITMPKVLDAAAKKLETKLADRPALRAKLQVTLAGSYHALGLYREAIPLLEAALKYQRSASGPDHPDTLSIMQNLAWSCFNAGRREDALRMREAALMLCQKSFGKEHPNTLLAVQHLADSYDAAGRLNEALKLREDGLQLRRKVLGSQNSDTLWAMRTLADSKLQAGRVEDAASLLAEASVANPGDTQSALKAAAIYVWYGRTEEHMALCRRMLTWAASTNDYQVAERVAKLCSLRPCNDPTMRRDTVALARRALELGKGNKEFAPWAEMTLGMAEYRSENYPVAEEKLSAASSTASATGAVRSRVEGISSFYRAMTLFKQGNQSDAGRLFTATEKTMKPLPTDEDNPVADGKISHDYLILWLAYKEARELLKIAPTRQP